MKIFRDRQAAGQLLARKLKGIDADLILAIPRGGVVVASEIAKKLNLPLDIIITRKIGDPQQKELALGAVDPDGEVLWDLNLMNNLGLKIENLELKIEDERNEIKRREEVYRQGKKPLDISEKTVILTDDGIATGATILSAVNYLKRHQAEKVIVAAPVANKQAVEKLSKVTDEFVILHLPEHSTAVSQSFQDFREVTDEEVIEMLK